VSSVEKVFGVNGLVSAVKTAHAQMHDALTDPLSVILRDLNGRFEKLQAGARKSGSHKRKLNTRRSLSTPETWEYLPIPPVTRTLDTIILVTSFSASVYLHFAIGLSTITAITPGRYFESCRFEYSIRRIGLMRWLNKAFFIELEKPTTFVSIIISAIHNARIARAIE
jgi:hypothetical protein